MTFTQVSHPKLSVIMPVFNEEASLERVIKEHIDVITRLPVDAWEIVCLDDASTDESKRILQKLEKEIAQLRVITHKKNLGINASFRELQEAAEGDIMHIFKNVEAQAQLYQFFDKAMNLGMFLQQ